MIVGYQQYEHLKVSLDGSVLNIILDNPPLNAMTALAHTELARIWGDASNDPQVRVLVLTGAGERAFCAGGDLKRMVDTWGDRANWLVGITEARAIIVGMLECSKPIIARINGHAMGLGASLALASDITIMVEDARIADSHISVGLAPGDGGALLWPNLVGLAAARRHLFTGDPLTGTQAAANGLITEAVARAELDGAVRKWIDIFLSKSPSAVKTTKQALNLDILDKARQFMDEMLRLETTSWESPNHLEAVRALLAKRPAHFADE
jgi:enoyl-CoA hydratase